MTDTFEIGQVDSSDLVCAEEDAVVAIGRQWSDCDALATEGLWHLPEPSFEADVILAHWDSTYDLVVIVFDLGKPVRHGSRTRSISACRHLLTERFVRPFEIVDQTPLIE